MILFSMAYMMLQCTETQVGFVNSLAFAKSGKFLIAGVAQVNFFVLYLMF